VDPYREALRRIAGRQPLIAAVYLYGQCEVARPEDLTAILGLVRRSLRPGAPLAVETRVASVVR
jgi:hypothetical protein